jgi:hypothetical protein
VQHAAAEAPCSLLLSETLSMQIAGGRSLSIKSAFGLALQASSMQHSSTMASRYLGWVVSPMPAVMQRT